MVRLLETRLPHAKLKTGGYRLRRTPTAQERIGTEIHLHQDVKLSPAGYLRAAHAYMLISMPTGTSTIFGAFQAIWGLLGNRLSHPSSINYRTKKSSPTKSLSSQVDRAIVATQEQALMPDASIS
jgi:hypothetical protein